MENRGVSFLNILTFIFIILKVVGVIEWSWWLVLSPTLIPLGVVSIIIVVVTMVIGVAEIMKFGDK